MMELVSKSLASREEGQTMAEYAVVLGVITIAVVGVFGVLSGAISTVVTNVTGII
jgi:Flp pilus assembly pilin Flp